jgi:hypothetical protein
MAGIPAVDDDAEMAMVRGKSYISDRQYDELTQLIEVAQADNIKFLKAFAIESLSDLDVTQFSKAKSMLKRKADQLKEQAKDNENN